MKVHKKKKLKNLKQLNKALEKIELPLEMKTDRALIEIQSNG